MVGGKIISSKNLQFAKAQSAMEVILNLESLIIVDCGIYIFFKSILLI